MTALPDLSVDPTLEAIDQALVARQERGQRTYYGISYAGQPCARRRWLTFRMCALGGEMSAESLKAIEDGRRGEAMQAERLRLVEGVELITHHDGKQIEVEAVDGHVKGHLDGAIRGLLQAPKTWHVWEHKQVNEKRWTALRKAKDDHGEKAALEQWDAVYYGQAQLYMRYTGMERHYLTVSTPGGRATISCRTEYDPGKAAKLERDARAVIYATEPPMKVSEDPAWYECKFCPFHAQCHGEARPAVTCRSCAHSTPIANGAWQCERHGDAIPDEFQREGCAEHRYIPAAIAHVAELVAANGDRVKWRNRLTGAEFSQPEYDSRELFSANDFRTIGDKGTDFLKATFGATVLTATTKELAMLPVETGDAPRSDLHVFYGTQADGPSASRAPAKDRTRRSRSA